MPSKLMKLYALILVMVMTVSTASATTLEGYVTTNPNLGAADRCVINVQTNMSKLRQRSDIMGFHDGAFPILGEFKHWQGVARLQGANRQYMAVSHSNNSQAAGVGIVQMGSRNTTGERFRSNRLSTTSDARYTIPPYNDQIVKYVPVVSPVTGNRYSHIGGIQVYGDMMVVPGEDRASGNQTSTNSEILFYDVSNPNNPVIRPFTIQSAKNAGAVSMSRLESGKYLLAVSEDNGLHFYVSSTTSLADNTTTFSTLYVWSHHYDGFGPGSVDNNWSTGSGAAFDYPLSRI